MDMDEFLKQIKFGSIYNQLTLCNVPKDEKGLLGLNGKSVKNQLTDLDFVIDHEKTRIVRQKYWTHMIDRKIGHPDTYIKLYIPLNYQNYGYAFSTIMDHIENEGIIHNSKIGPEVRTDDFIVRVKGEDKNAAFDIISFITDKKLQQTSFNAVNPFIPTTNEVGIMFEDGSSYNTTISELISEYLILCTKYRQQAEVDNFKSFMKDKRAIEEVDELTYSTFMEAYKQDKQKKLILH